MALNVYRRSHPLACINSWSMFDRGGGFVTLDARSRISTSGVRKLGYQTAPGEPVRGADIMVSQSKGHSRWRVIGIGSRFHGADVSYEIVSRFHGKLGAGKAG
ncbi:NADPH-dependent FMN reductase [Corchorus olitorius]|uniref:NADPH-dependent FMN reductase n=1 Tax=Corchorus olitorius TaxID=93759 RepID=A0A1R3HM29_9ROSI|nr:NADPH-dependent FMN reductase [Corchorus olitorius]